MVSASETPGSKRETRLITYSSGGDSTQIDYILYHKSFSSAVRNVKVIPNEECVKQHYMVLCDFSTHIPRVIKKSSQPCIRTWKMRDPATANEFQSAFKIKTMTAVAAASGADTDTANCVESAWSKLKGPLLGCCYRTLWPLQEPPVETRNVVVDWRGGQCYKWETCTVQSLQCPEEGRHGGRGQGGKTAYIDNECVAKHTVWLAKSEAEKEEFTTVSPGGDGVSRIAKQIDRTNQNCVCNDAGELVLTDEDKMKAWFQHYARLINFEFEWPSNELPEVPPTSFRSSWTVHLSIVAKKHSIATITQLRSLELLIKTPLLHMLYYMNWLTHDFWTRTGGWGFDRSHGAGTSSPSHSQQVEQQAPKPVGWTMCFLLMTLVPVRSSVLIIIMIYIYAFLIWVLLQDVYIYTTGVSFSIGEAAPHHVLQDCISGECAVPGLNATFCFLWFTNCVLLFDISIICHI